MKIIIRDALLKYKVQNIPKSQQLINYIQNHPYYHNSLSTTKIVKEINMKLSNKKQLQQNHQQILEQLELYLNRQSNSQLFSVLKHILKYPSGLTYDQIAKYFKIDIINTSHYCCRLKKMKFITLKHFKDGLMVYPKNNHIFIQQQIQQQQQEQQSIQSSFCFYQLPLSSNIWINVSSVQTSIQGSGISNQQIKWKVLKQAQTKMARRIVQNFKFQKVAQRQGKVYQYKYKNQTIAIKKQMERTKSQQEKLQLLNQQILNWLKIKFPQFQGSNFLLNLINDRLKQYVSSLGIKQSKRQCTPLKLSRIIKCLNYLNQYGQQTQVQLRKYIIQYQKNLNIGKMHKRSLIGILQGLVNLQILKNINGYYYPYWKQISIKLFQQNQQYQQQQQPSKKKKIKLNQIQINKKQSFKMITHNIHKLQIFVSFIQFQIGTILNNILKKSFQAIKKVHRKKQQPKLWNPIKNIIGILQDQSIKIKDISSQNYNQFIKQIDQYVQNQGILQKKIPIGSQVIRHLRKTPFWKKNYTITKYGKNWRQKFQPLLINNWIQETEEHINLKIIPKRYLI